ncbi:MAG TPA: cytidine deaminase [Clostridiales bacterium]|jgi:cytidine deaminase|nr:cytidine deaminase [Clostridiales bacterium]
MSKISEKERETMLDLAYEAMERAYTPYSRFQVGACLKGKSGRYYLGCNIESASYTPTNCAERTAVFKAVSEGEREFESIVIVCSGKNPAAPCGVCRQVLREFCSDDMPVVFADGKRNFVESTLGALLPHSFGPEDLL